MFRVTKIGFLDINRHFQDMLARLLSRSDKRPNFRVEFVGVCLHLGVVGPDDRCKADGDVRGDFEDPVDNISHDVCRDVEIYSAVHVVCTGMDQYDVGSGFDRHLPVSVDVGKKLSAVSFMMSIYHISVLQRAHHVHLDTLIEKLLPQRPAIAYQA
ncbi:hypothetical protein HG530_010571 [Fusarium avenaceum]|nr:hypothetical protein HG530_010571 [Fusarium avenaceum]